MMKRTLKTVLSMIAKTVSRESCINRESMIGISQFIYTVIVVTCA